MKNVFSYIYLFLSILLLHSNLTAQEETEILCQLIDESSKKPVIYATILLKENKLGVISDEDGNFRIPYRFRQRSDTLRISSIGYKTTYFALTDMMEEQVNVLIIAPKIESLNEVTLVSDKNKKSKLSARKIVKNAIENIPINYPKEKFSYIAYYRDYQQLLDSTYLRLIKSSHDNRYINLNEGIIEVFDAGFGTNKLMHVANQTALHEFKTNKNFAIDSSLTIPYDNRSRKYVDGVTISPLGGNELNILNLTNAIRNYDRMSFSFIHVLNKDLLANHSFKLVQIKYLDELPIYEIKFVLNSQNSQNYTAEGLIFIAKETFAIHKLTYNLYERGKKNHLYAVSMEYARNGEYLYLNYITFNNSFEVRVDNYFKIVDVSYNFSNAYFTLIFNNNIDEASITPWSKNFKIEYKGQRLKILNVKLVDRNKLQVKAPNIYIKDRNNFGKYVKITVKNIEDLNGGLIDEVPVIKVNQFREIFVQQVFPNKEANSELFFVNKNTPLSKSKLNSSRKESDYWINTPLKSSKLQ